MKHWFFWWLISGQERRHRLIGRAFTRWRLTWRTLWSRRIALTLAAASLALLAWLLYRDNAWELKDLLDIATLLAVVFTAGQVAIEKASSDMQVSDSIFTRDAEVTRDTQAAAELSKELYEACRQEAGSFAKMYDQDHFQVLKAYAYHYEYMGQLVYRNQLQFELVFDTVSFPDSVFVPFFRNDEEIAAAYKDRGLPFPVNTVVEDIRETCGLPDRWLGLEYLYRTYELKRKYNRLLSLAGKKPGKTGRKETRGTAAGAALWDEAMKAYRHARSEWNEIYMKMPL